VWKKKPGEKRFDEPRRGPCGPRGPAGPAGRAGARGAPGSRGKTGPRGQPALIDSLEAVDQHIEKIDQELRTQLQRIAQIQQELDEVRGVVQRVNGPCESGRDRLTGTAEGTRTLNQSAAAALVRARHFRCLRRAVANRYTALSD
jgi:hypothetical protein